MRGLRSPPSSPRPCEVDAARALVQQHCSGRLVRRVVAREGGGGPRDGLFDDKVVAEGVPEARIVQALQAC